MQILQSFRYALGSKPAFDRLPAIIDEFLERHALTHRAFHYCFQDYDHSEMFRAVVNGDKCRRCGAPSHACDRCHGEAERYLRRGPVCQRAAAEHPFLGPVYTQRTPSAVVESLRNFDDDTNGSKEAVCGILTKIYRRYGFAEARLIYRDIDFFSREATSALPVFEIPAQVHPGSSITILRSGFPAGNAVILTAASDDPADVPDPRPYAEALKQHLGCKNYLSATEVLMTEEERAFYEDLNQKAATPILKTTAYFDERIPERTDADDVPSNAGVAAQLKKLAARFGYTYIGYTHYIYFLEKKLPEGHYICLEFVSNPRCPGADPFVTLRGLGFSHPVWKSHFHPRDAKDAREYLTAFFETLSEAEKTLFPAILDPYPGTPDWFRPSH